MSTSRPKTRDSILTKLRCSMSNPDNLFRSGEVHGSTGEVPSAVTSALGSGKTLAMAFGEKLVEVLGSYDFVEHSTTVPKKIVEQIERWRAGNDGPAEYGSEVLSWATSDLPIANLDVQLQQLGVSLNVPGNLHDRDERRRAASLPVGLTGVDAAFAGTGSILLLPGPGKSRAASLLPLHHIALVPMTRIHETFESWLATLRNEKKLATVMSGSSQLTFITGPSKSADIELNLTLGVHGPRDVHAIVFDDGD